MKNEDIVKRYEQHRSDRVTVESNWDDIERYIYPLGGGKFFQEQSQEGEMDWNRSRYIFDSTAIMAHRTLAASVQSNIAPLTGRWFDLRFKQKELNNDLEAQQWLDEVGNSVFQTLQESDFNLEFGKSCMDLAAFGNTAIVQEVPNEEEWEGVDFSSIPIREIFYDPDKDGQIKHLYRRLQWEPSRIMDKFGMDNIPEDLKKKWEAGSTTREEIIFCIFCREDKKYADASKPLAPTERPYGFKYLLKTGLVELGEEGGYYEMPAFFAAWSKASGSKWGTGPGNTALGDTLSLNDITRQKLQAGAKLINPPMLTTQRNLIGDLDLEPGGETIVRDVNNIRPLETGADTAATNDMIDRFQDSIRRIFHNDQLQLKESPAMTATEVQVRYELMQKVLGSVLGQLQNGLLDPIVQRTFGILTRAGRLPEMPEVVQEMQGTVEIEYTGPMARSQKSDKAVAMERYLMTMSQVGQVFPEMLDNVDPDEFAKQIADFMGVPASALRDDEAVAQIREQRAQQQQQQQQQEQQMAQAQMMKDAGGAAKSLAEAGGMAGGEQIQ